MTVRKGIFLPAKYRICVPTENTRRRNGAGNLFGENGNQTKRRTHMENNLKKLPPLERKPDGSLHRMTPAQRKRANALIRRECCSYDSGNCIVLDDGDTCICPQTISFSVCCKHFAGLSCRWIGRWKQRFSGIRTQNGVLSVGKLLFPALIGRNTVPTAPPAFTGGRKQKVNGKGGRAWTIRGEKACIYGAFRTPNRGRWYSLSLTLKTGLLIVHKTL